MITNNMIAAGRRALRCGPRRRTDDTLVKDIYNAMIEIKQEEALEAYKARLREDNETAN